VLLLTPRIVDALRYLERRVNLLENFEMVKAHILWILEGIWMFKIISKNFSNIPYMLNILLFLLEKIPHHFSIKNSR